MIELLSMCPAPSQALSRHCEDHLWDLFRGSAPIPIRPVLGGSPHMGAPSANQGLRESLATWGVTPPPSALGEKLGPRKLNAFLPDGTCFFLDWPVSFGFWPSPQWAFLL